MASPLPDTDSEDELPPGWEERTTEDGQIYYANHSNQDTQWVHPKTGKKKRIAGEMPHGWEKKVDASTGTIIYVDHINKKTSLTDPRLAFAVEDVDDSGYIRQRFDGSSTALQIVAGRDLSSKTVIVTGANTGIGYETSRTLALHGCHVIMACRSREKGEGAVARLRAERSEVKVEVMELDLSSLASVRAFVEKYKVKKYPLHMLILNAGVFGLPFELSEDGFELTFQVNHLSQLYLTLMLEETLVRSATERSRSRVIILSSESHRYTNLSLSNLSESKLSPSVPSQYTSMFAYNLSKLCNILTANQINKLWHSRGVVANSVHPGNMVNTDIARQWWFYRVIFTLARPFTKSLQQGAACSVYAATASELEGVGGMYFNNCRACQVSSKAQDEQLADRLWRLSLDMIRKVTEKGDGDK